MGIEFVGDDEAEAVVVDLDVTLDHAAAGARAAYDGDAFFRGGGAGGERVRAEVAVADAGDHQAAGPGSDGGVDERAVHAGVGEDEIDARKRGARG